jgi:transcriptional regulator with GAF, ATPase, and Fis domain
MPFLEFKGPDGSTLRYPIVRRLITIGASDECHVIVRGDGVASSHLTLTHEPGRYRLQSTARACQFFVGGKKYRDYDLRHGDIFSIGVHEIAFSALDLPERPNPELNNAIGLQLEALQRLQQFSRLLLEPFDSSGILNEIIDHVVALTRASKGFLVLATGQSGYEIRVARNLERQPVDDPGALLSDDIIREVITTRKPQIISDALKDQRFQNSLSVINLRLSSVMCAPLIVRGELQGLIYVGNEKIVDLFTPIQLDTLMVFASQAALFLKTAQVLDELRSESADLARRLENVRFGSLIGACPQMIEVYKRVEKVAATDITALIHGETGTGKELIAREVHVRSPRSKGPFVTVNCGAIPENLIESELFGHVKGAFTGATTQQIGKFESANTGTLFLDEIGELPLALQVKLLRALQEKVIQRVGSTQSIPVDIRIVAATNRDLRKEVAEGRFREDLYFRLAVIDIELPPLRDRGDDILTLARYLIARYAKEFGLKFDPANCLDQGAISAMLRYSWPGNIRQLENHIKKALVLAESSQIRASDLDLETIEGADEPTQILPLADARELWQRHYINKVLALNNGNRTKAARDLEVDPRTIFRHLEREEKNRRGEP